MNKIYRAGNEVIVFDATPDLIPYMKRVNPGFRIESVRPSPDYEPLLQSAIRDKALDRKLDQAMGALQRCELCTWRCRKQIYKEPGKCGLSGKVYYYSPFVSIGEEAVINPAIMANFSLCSMDCVFCIRKDESKEKSQYFNIDAFWKKVLELLNKYPDVNALEFGGGDPSIHLPWVLAALRRAPENINLPIVWNCNLYLTSFSLDLLAGIVDVYLPDFSFGNDSCAQRLAGACGYWRNATESIEKMVNDEKARIIARILVMPRHYSCCYRKIFDFLAPYRDKLWLSILQQYTPAYKANKYNDINRRPTREEIMEVKTLAEKYGLRDINEDWSGFWE
jgi:putative pyruvate formate lyase activating enzyme